MNAEQALRTVGATERELEQTAPEKNLQLLRVIEQHRAHFVLSDGAEQVKAQAHPKLKHKNAELRPGVGDFVWLDPKQKLFCHVLARKNSLKRAAAGERHAEQLLAANLDRVFIVCGLDRDYSERRIERYLALVQGSHLAAAVILSKADQHDDAADLRTALATRLGGGVPVLAMDTRDASAIAAIQALLPSGTGVLLGSSGAGKSSLSNTLLESEIMQTGTVRERDGRGRHTTVHRALLKLNWGACLIDSPGLREIKLTGEEELEQQSFPDIHDWAQQCKFRDCAHELEPGCRVNEAVEKGELELDRLLSFKKLQGERDQTLARIRSASWQSAGTKLRRR